MFDKTQLNAIMSRAGYDEVRDLTYRAAWSTDEVEHFVYYAIHGRTDRFLTAHFGLRNPCAEAFSVLSIQKYGGRFMFDALRYDKAASCTMRFAFGRLTPDAPG